VLLAVTAVSTSIAGPAPAEAVAAPSAVRATAPQRADAIRNDQWQLDEFDARAAWRVSTGKGVVVAVIDSGVDGSHPDLAGQVLPGIDLVQPSGGDGQTDPVGHGTTVAGLIAGHNDSRGIVGLAPDAKILPVRVLDEANRYDDALVVAKGVRWAVDHGARVINLSLGGTGESPALAAALDYAFARDVVVVACTGNLTASSSTKVWYPAREPGVVAVAGMERNTDSLWSGSITGPETVLTAPATGLVGARPGGFWRVQGTSFAAPLVAASAALLRARWPNMSAANVINRLVRTARDLGPPGRDDRFGYGLVNPVAALNAEVSNVDHNPLVDNTSPGVAGFGHAPSVVAPTPTGSRADQPGLAAPGGRAKWAAQPAGAPDSGSRGGVWVGGVLFLVLVTGSALLIRRRFRRVRPRH
jgi:type VII secretion-associated serine protease mycosin